MKGLIRKAVSVLIVLLIPNLLNAYYVFQSDWSGGPGVTGPVTWYWHSNFSTQSQTSWISVPPGKLLLGVSTVSHTINSGMGGCHYAFPADMDGDGDLDVIACGTFHKYVSWFENLDDTCGTWEEHVLATTLDEARGVHAADVTDDGFVDILVAVWEDNQLYLYKNMDGTGMEWAVYLLRSGWWFEDVDVADFNGDGFTDILAGATDGVELLVCDLSGKLVRKLS